MSETPGIEQTDHELLARLAGIADRVDPVPARAYEWGRVAFDLGQVDAELAELVRDSAVDTEALAGVRGELTLRLLSFEVADLALDLQVMPQADRRSILGQVIGVAAEVSVQTAEGTCPAVVDPQGLFRLDDLPSGRIRVHIISGGAGYVTNWVGI